MSASEQIRVSEEVKRQLDERKRPGESYNDVLERMIENEVEGRRAAIREGAGVWEGTDAPAAAREARRTLSEEIGPDE